jgi:hypothetical protein
MTLYSLLTTEYKGFKLSQRAIEQLGMQMSERYKRGNLYPCPKIRVSEPHGTFLVNDYPDEYIPVARVLIEEFYKRITEKPVGQSLSKTTTSVPSQDKKQRKRIPLNNKSKP